MPGMSIHAVDIARGAAAAGLRVRVEKLDGDRRTLLAEGEIAPNGLLQSTALEATMPAEVYEATFMIGEYVRRFDGPTARTFLDSAPFRFTIDDPERHCHLPFKFTAFGFSCFRGEA